MYVCVCACGYVCVRAHTCACVRLRASLFVCVRCVRAYTVVYVRTCVRACIMYLCVCVCGYVYAHVKGHQEKGALPLGVLSPQERASNLFVPLRGGFSVFPVHV
jgi:hypothetical protein